METKRKASGKLTDNDQFKRVCENLDKQRKEGKNCDAIIRVENETFHAHKCILVANSSYFSAMFNSEFKEQDGEVQIPGFSANAFRWLLDYMYGHKLNLETAKIEDILKGIQLSDYLCFDIFLTDCKTYLKKWSAKENVGDFFLLCRELKMSEEVDAMIKYAITLLPSIIRSVCFNNSKIKSISFELMEAALVKEMPLLDIDREPNYFFKVTSYVRTIIDWLFLHPNESIQSASVLLNLVHVQLLPSNVVYSVIKDVQRENRHHSRVNFFNKIVDSLLIINRPLLGVKLKVILINVSESVVTLIKYNQAGNNWISTPFFLDFDYHLSYLHNSQLYLFGNGKLRVYDVETTSFCQEKSGFVNQPYSWKRMTVAENCVYFIGYQDIRLSLGSYKFGDNLPEMKTFDTMHRKSGFALAFVVYMRKIFFLHDNTCWACNSHDFKDLQMICSFQMSVSPLDSIKFRNSLPLIIVVENSVIILTADSLYYALIKFTDHSFRLSICNTYFKVVENIKGLQNLGCCYNKDNFFIARYRQKFHQEIQIAKIGPILKGNTFSVLGFLPPLPSIDTCKHIFMSVENDQTAQ